MDKTIRITRPLQSTTGALPAWNEIKDANGQVRPHWMDLNAKIQRWTLDERHTLSSAAARLIEDLGTTFNVFSDAGGVGQPYELDPIPLLIPPADWKDVSAGLVQRHRVLETVLADLYGPQQLLREGLIPPDLVHSSPSFFHYSRGIQPVGGRFLVMAGCDLIRDPHGQWTVLRDHTGTPGGLGQALENRNVTSNLLSDQFEALRISPLGDFFDLERRTLQSLLEPRGEMPNVVFLTPGFRHPSYFEHAYKARLLGFPLVEAADLTVRERRLFLKTLSGLRRIDGIASRIEESGLDPLENWVRGRGGVPGLIEAWRTGNVAIANAPGAGFASSPALMPFLPGICRKWFGEEMKLPFVETWWLGQPEIRRKVLEQLHRYVLLPAFTHDPLLPLRCSNLSTSSRRQWLATIAERPHDFVVQLDITPSEAPALESRGIRQRPVMWRAFSVNSADGPVVMPGGLARVGKIAQAPQLWPAHAGFTKDIWISDETANFATRAEVKSPRAVKDRHPSALEVPSRIAEQLFWVGRYAERIELATRLLRVTLRTLVGEAGQLQQKQLAACLALIDGSNLASKEGSILPADTLTAVTALIHDATVRGGIPKLTRSLLLNAAAARDRLSDDTWRFFNRLEGFVHPPAVTASAPDLLRTLDTLVLHLSAFAGMQAENMTRGHGWRFLEVGRRIERALSGLMLLKTAAGQGTPEPDVLDPLLETCDSVMTYRRRHFSRPRMDGVMALIFFDHANPRSVAFQIAVINGEMGAFPGDPDFGLLPNIREHLHGLGQRFNSSAAPDAEELEALSESVEALADMLTQHYFSHSVRRVY